MSGDDDVVVLSHKSSFTVGGCIADNPDELRKHADAPSAHRHATPEGADEGGAQSKGIRKSEAAARNAFIERGAILLHFEMLPSSESVVCGDVLSAWNRIERFGFVVLADTGCLIPQAQFRSKFGSTGLRLAYQCATALFHGVRVNYKEESGSFNEHGWPTDRQVSHLCHTGDCCNPCHLVVEERWKNFKRNYCGKEGKCDCGMQPPCIRTYSPRWFEQDRPMLRYNEAHMGEKIRDFVGGGAAYAVTIRPANYFAVEDQKRSNRVLRIKRAAKHKAQTDRHTAQKAAKKAAVVQPAAGKKQ